MQRLAQGLALALIAIVAVACGGGGATSAPASSAPSAGASASAGSGLAVVARNLVFEQTTLTAPADTAFQIDFDNQDSAPHNVAIKDASGAEKFKGEIVTAKKVTYNVAALPAGSYTFWCEVHPNMTGTLTVQ
jgi:plastocyanin